MERYLVLDTETTGLKPFQGDKMIEIGIVEILNGQITGKSLQHYLQPDKVLSKESIKIHNITDEMLKDKPRFKEVSDQIVDFICNPNYENHIVAHNANFDMKFLHNECNNEQVEKLKKVDIIDTLTIARKKFPNEKVNLDALCKKFNLDTSEREKMGHGALLDSTLLANIFINFLRYQNFKELSEKKIIFFGIIKRSEILMPRIFNNKKENDHEYFLKNILKIENVW